MRKEHSDGGRDGAVSSNGQQQPASMCVARADGTLKRSSRLSRDVSCAASLHSSREACIVTAAAVTSAPAPVQQAPAGSSAAPAPGSLHGNCTGNGHSVDWHSESETSITVSVRPPQQPPSSSQPATGNNIIPVAAATAAAAHKSVHSAEDGMERSHSHEEQRHRQASHAQAALDTTSRRVWLPEKHLWMPTSSHNGSSSSSHILGSNNSNSSGAATTAAGLYAGPDSHTSGSGKSLSRVYMGAAATRGRKKSMEDRHVLAALDPRHGVTAARGPVGLEQQVSVAAVFDGHAGYATAAYAAQHIPHLLHEALSGRPSRAGDGGPRVPRRELLPPGHALAASFHWFDRWWADARCDPAFTEHGWDDSGSTAVVGMVSGQQLIVANAGDSIALLARGGASQRLSVEHRLDNVEEAERVLEAGGRVVAFKPGAAPRVMGDSNQTRFKGSMVTRSLGDFAFKHPQALISADPHVAQQDLSPSDRIVVLTSDGVTDVLPDDDMLDVALRAIEETQHSTNNGNALAKAAAVAIMNAALNGGSTDNITVVTILLDWGGEYATD